MRGKRLLPIVAGLSALVLAACSAGTTQSGGPTAGLQGGQVDANSVAVDKGGTLVYSISVDVKNWNVLQATGDVFGYRQVLNAILPHAMISQPDFTMAPDPNLLVSAEQTSASPQTVVYKIRPEATWSDGTPITADDFAYTWKTQDPAQCPACQPSNKSGYDQISSVTGSDEGKTVTVTFSSPFQPWKLLFPYLLPAKVAAAHGDLATSFNDYFTATVPTWSGGPFVIDSYTPGQLITLTPNPKWYGKGPNLDRLIFRIITDERQAVTAMSNNEIQVLSPTPTVDIVEQLKGNSNLTVTTAAGLLYEHVDINIANPALSDLALRKAIFTAIPRQSIIDKTVGQIASGITPLGSRMFMPGQKLDGVDAYKDSVTPLGLGSGDIAAATKILTDAGYTRKGTDLIDSKGKVVPALRMVYSKGNQTRKETSVLLQSTLAQLGIKLNLEETDSLGKTITSSDFDVIIYGTNLDVIPTTTAQALFSPAKPPTGYKDPELDSWLTQASAATSPQATIDLLDKVDARLSEQAITLPLYQTPSVTAYRSDVGNVRINPTRFGTTYNVADWGLRSK